MSKAGDHPRLAMNNKHALVKGLISDVRINTTPSFESMITTVDILELVLKYILLLSNFPIQHVRQAIFSEQFPYHKFSPKESQTHTK
jgi:hypothetical protein